MCPHASTQSAFPAAPVRIVPEARDKAIQTDPRPVSPARKPDLFRKVTRQQPTQRSALKTAPPAPAAAPQPVPKPRDAPLRPPAGPRPRLDEPKHPVLPRPQPAELRDQAVAARVPQTVQLADPVGDEVAHSLPHAADAAPPTHRPTLAPKRQPRSILDQIKIPTSLLKRRGPAAHHAEPDTAHASPNDPTSEAPEDEDAAMASVAGSDMQTASSQQSDTAAAAGPSRRQLRTYDASSDAAAGRQNPGLPLPKLATVQGSSHIGTAQQGRPGPSAGAVAGHGAAAKRLAPHASASVSSLSGTAAGAVAPSLLGLSGHASGGKARTSRAIPPAAASADISPAVMQHQADSADAADLGLDQVASQSHFSGAEQAGQLDSQAATDDDTSAAAREAALQETGTPAGAARLSPDLDPTQIAEADVEQHESAGSIGDGVQQGQAGGEDEEAEEYAYAATEEGDTGPVAESIAEAEAAVQYRGARHGALVQREVQRRIRHHR